MGISGCELLEVHHHPNKFCDPKHCDSGDVFNLSHDLS